MDNVRVNGGRIIKEPKSNENWKPKIVEDRGGFCLETLFSPGNGALSAKMMAVVWHWREEHGEWFYFEVFLLSTCLKTTHETLTLKSHREHRPGPEDFCSSAWPAPGSLSQTGFGICMVQQQWGCDPSLICGDISALQLKPSASGFSCILWINTQFDTFKSTRPSALFPWWFPEAMSVYIFVVRGDLLFSPVCTNWRRQESKLPCLCINILIAHILKKQTTLDTRCKWLF